MSLHRSLVSFVAAVGLFFAVVAPSAGQADIVLAFGDSITWGLGDTGVVCPGDGTPRSGGYPLRLPDRLESRGLVTLVRNLGVCGELTSGGVSRMPDVLAANDDAGVVVIMEGTNDISDRDISTESMRTNIGMMAQMVLEAEMWPVVASPIPRSPEAAGSNERMGFLTSLIREDAENAGIDFANPFDDMIDIVDLYDRFYADPYHPNPSGYDLLTSSLVDATATAVERLPVLPDPCVADTTTLCLAEGRFEVRVDFVDGEGDPGEGQAVPRTEDTGLFWFFDETNLELVVKVLDARAINGAFWVFYGALSDVEYSITVRDSVTGVSKVYDNPAGTLASQGDTGAFPVGEDGASLRSLEIEAGVAAIAVPPVVERGTTSPGVCVASSDRLCLAEGRFAVTASWRDADDRSGDGTAVELTSETGYFWFFDDANIELVIKVLDGTALNGAYWVFYGALSNVAYRVEVVDTTTGDTAAYINPLDNFGSVNDTGAFPQP